ncbi:XK-related protein 6 [Caerostris extrusa]|uniref:XK-related protein n=1 Tax=Caerostris extrusa TaxID=172846 RepID=A0AAV4NMC6_CAEEX|nr:XK-related protein 6 [Caerostris extrusa]
MNATKNKSRGDESATDSPDDSDLDGRNPNSKLGRNSGPFLKKIKIKGYDTTDALPKNLNFSTLDMLVCFIAVPSLTMTGFSLRWYLVDADEKRLPPVSTTRWVLRIVFLVLQMGPLLRYMDSLNYGLKSNRNKSNVQDQVDLYKQMIYEDADATLLRLFECFMEAAPQLVLQLYIYALSQADSPNFYTWTEIIQLISMFSSLISLAWALASYQRALRYSLEEKKNMTLCGSIVQVIWRFF